MSSKSIPPTKKWTPPAGDTLWQAKDGTFVRVRVVADAPTGLGDQIIRVSGAWADRKWFVQQDDDGRHLVEIEVAPITVAADADVDLDAMKAAAIEDCVARTARQVRNYQWAKAQPAPPVAKAVLPAINAAATLPNLLEPTEGQST